MRSIARLVVAALLVITMVPLTAAAQETLTNESIISMELRFQICHIAILVAEALRLRQPDSVDDRCMRPRS